AAMPDDDDGVVLVEEALACPNEVVWLGVGRVPATTLDPQDGRAGLPGRPDDVVGQGHPVLVPVHHVGNDLRGGRRWRGGREGQEEGQGPGLHGCASATRVRVSPYYRAPPGVRPVATASTFEGF